MRGYLAGHDIGREVEGGVLLEVFWDGHGGLLSLESVEE